MFSFALSVIFFKFYKIFSSDNPSPFLMFERNLNEEGGEIVFRLFDLRL